MKKDLEFGTDLRGDEAIFIEEKHFDENGWSVNCDLTDYPPEPMFFRVIKNGRETSSHGWVNTETGEILQWG